ncbi:MAG TPA: hypothetical protein H9845_04535 [Candidatus Agathobaculum pullicola]|nr:hypothetical protein [Candidatus Agathobaculum pullicola]
MNLKLKKESEVVHMFLHQIALDETVPMSNSLCTEQSLCEHLLEAKRNREQGVKGIPAVEVLAQIDAIIDKVEAHE